MKNYERTEWHRHDFCSNMFFAFKKSYNIENTSDNNMVDNLMDQESCVQVLFRLSIEDLQTMI